MKTSTLLLLLVIVAIVVAVVQGQIPIQFQSLSIHSGGTLHIASKKHTDASGTTCSSCRIKTPATYESTEDSVSIVWSSYGTKFDGCYEASGRVNITNINPTGSDSNLFMGEFSIKDVSVGRKCFRWTEDGNSMVINTWISPNIDTCPTSSLIPLCQPTSMGVRQYVIFTFPTTISATSSAMTSSAMTSSVYERFYHHHSLGSLLVYLCFIIASSLLL